MTEEPLAGGVANVGRVVRIGSRVHRPSGPHAQSIHWFLRKISESGFDGASVPVDIDEDGREVLTFIEGDVALPPYPLWAQSDDALASVTRLLARFHQASVCQDPSGLDWSEELADPIGGSMVCHNDVCLENVVFRDGVAVALLDFDDASPGRATYDLAQFAKMCVPLDRPERIARLGWVRPDQAARLRLVADVYGLDRERRSEFLRSVFDAMKAGEEFVARHFRAGEAGFVKMVEHNGGLGRWSDQQQWWLDNATVFEHAMFAPGDLSERELS